MKLSFNVICSTAELICSSEDDTLYCRWSAQIRLKTDKLLLSNIKSSIILNKPP